jgi:hypothetical protein
MATAINTDLKLYDEQIQAGMWEGVAQALTAFNAASAGTILTSSKSHPGNYSKEAMWGMISGLLSARDPLTTSNATAVKPAQVELIGVKTKTIIGPVEITLDALRAIETPLDEYSFVLGQQIGQAKVQRMINLAVAAVEAALQAQTDLNYSALTLSTKTLKTAYLVSAMAKMGDAGQRIAAWVMHSKQYFDLVGAQIGENLTGMSDKIVYGASAATLGRPVVISDIPALINDVASTDTYQVLGLVPGAVSIEESEQSAMVSQIISGQKNLINRTQGEYAATIKVKGCQWDVTSGGAAPSDAAIGTHTNWDKVATSIKDLPGVRLSVQ